MGIKNLWPFRKDSHCKFERLVCPHISRLYKLAYRLTGQRDDAEDLIQDLLLKLYPRLQELQKIEKLSPWLTRVLYRLFIDQKRREQRSPIDYTDNEEFFYETHASEDAGPAQVMNAELTREIIEKALHKLNENQRILILLHDVEGYSMLEISETIDIPVGTIKSRLSRSRQKLQEIIYKMEPISAHSVYR